MINLRLEYSTIANNSFVDSHLGCCRSYPIEKNVKKTKVEASKWEKKEFMKSETKWTKCRMSARESERVRGSERGEGCWLTLGQCWRGAVAFGSWLWRVHNAYCRATHHTNVCADAFTQRPALALPLSRPFTLSSSLYFRFCRRRIQNLPLSPSFPHKLAAFGKKICEE